jgi:hypothetical protein
LVLSGKSRCLDHVEVSVILGISANLQFQLPSLLDILEDQTSLTEAPV